ncbi:MAG: ABC transporter permease [Candidatus Aminicenantales bacterium]
MNSESFSKPRAFLRKGPSHKTALLVIGLFVLAALLADIISPYPPSERFAPYQKPNRAHLLGTNDIGNDILSELIHGTRISLFVGFGAGVIATLLGLFIGLISGYFGGIAEEVLMGLTDIFLLIPRIPLIIILAAFLHSGAIVIMLTLGLLWWTTTARVVRSRTLQVREMDFVASSRCLGFGHARIIVSDILPHILPLAVPKFMLTVATAMISEASLSFLGLGDPSMKSWGMMINFAFVKGGVINGMWWWYLPPGICVVLVVMSAVLISVSFEERKKVILR